MSAMMLNGLQTINASTAPDFRPRASVEENGVDCLSVAFPRECRATDIAGGEGGEDEEGLVRALPERRAPCPGSAIVSRPARRCGSSRR